MRLKESGKVRKRNYVCEEGSVTARIRKDEGVCRLTSAYLLSVPLTINTQKG